MGKKAMDIETSFKEAMRRLAASVTVVSAVEPRSGRKHAMTATAVTSLCMDPAALLICINESTTMHGILANGNDFCVNILFSDQERVSNACAGILDGVEDRFSIGEWTENKDGTPFLKDAQANIFCKNDAHMNYGTHKIFVGRVDQVLVREDISPLVYVSGKYSSVDCGSRDE